MLKRCSRHVKSVDYLLPAPVGGLNKRDPLSAMDRLDAIQMDNYIPLAGSIELRPGYETYAKLADFEASKKIETLACYNTSQTTRMIAVFDGLAYDVSSKTPSCFGNISFSQNRCQSVQYKNRLFLLNGTDTPKVFYVDDQNQTHLENWGFVGQDLNDTKIVNAGVSHEFLWFVEKNSTRAWVSSVGGNISGTLESFDVSEVLKWGGHLISVFNWTVDGGTGLDDYTCLMSSEGEVLIYKGYNPSDVDNWSLMGSYKLSKPIGYQCVMPFQGDVIIICQDGYMPLSKALSANNAVVSSLVFSDKIRGLVLDRAAMYQHQDGWQGIIYAKKGYAIFNVPVGNNFEQHVMNINTGAWCRFTNINATCWCLYDGELYFASGNTVYCFGKNFDDNGQAIEGLVEQAYSSLSSENLKKIVLLKPKLRTSKDFRLIIYTNMDYETRQTSYYVNLSSDSGAKWGKAEWNNAAWFSLKTKKMQGQWLANSATGFKASVVFKTKTAGNAIEWYETGIRFQTGTAIL